MPEPDDSAADLSHADVGIVCALHIELGSFLDRCERVRKYTGGDFTFRGGKYDDVRIAVVESGAGFVRARRATQALIEAHTPAWIISAGFAGALKPEMKVGDIVMADSIADTHSNQFSVELGMPPSPQKGLHVGRIITADEIVRRVDEKQALAEKHQGIAVDMESLAVAQICRDNKVRFLAVRVISDDMSTDLPPEMLSVIGSTGTTRLGAAVGSLLKRKGSIKEMWRLRESAHHAADSLATFLDGVVTQLYQAHH